MKQILAIIPARGGSVGLPRKNLRPLAGKPLLAFTVEAALGCRWVGKCIVSTDDDEIAETAKRLGCEVVKRPAELATSTASSESVVRHALECGPLPGGPPEVFALLQPTSPLRTAAHLSEACELFFRSPAAGSVVSVCETDHSPYKTFVVRDGVLEPFMSWEHLSMPRQLLPQTLRPNGAIYLTRSAPFLTDNKLLRQPVVPYVMSPRASVDIDTAEDLELCEQIYRQDAR